MRRRFSVPSVPPAYRPLTRAQIAVRVSIGAASIALFVVLAHRAWAALMDAQLETTPAVLTAFGLVALAHFVATVVLALRYQPSPHVSVWRLPALTVIVPAYDEGVGVRRAIDSAMACGYPRDRLEILAIDDGSRDDTWSHIQACAEAYPDVVVAIRQPKNRGKREALRLGFVRASGELVVTVDSDSELVPGALEAIVAPMLRDPSVGAVAGRVTVLNRDEGILPRLLSARFFLTFDLARAAQSVFGTVLCTPGALSAYRLSAVLDVLPRWSEQTFRGQPCTIAEDRALTTWLLRAGHRSVYQRTAEVKTVVPTTIRQAARMLVRWERGNLREDLVLLPALLTDWKGRARLWPALEMSIELAGMPAALVGLGLCAADLAAHPHAVGVAFLSVLSGALAQNVYTLRGQALSEFAYGVGYSMVAALSLFWLTPYSLATLRDGRWLTR